MSIKERLKQVIEIKGLSLKAFSDLTEIPYRSIQNYLRAEREPNLEALMKIGSKTDINLHWLITGEGSMFIERITLDKLTELEIQLLIAFNACDENIKRKIHSIINVIASD